MHSLITVAPAAFLDLTRKVMCRIIFLELPLSVATNKLLLVVVISKELSSEIWRAKQQKSRSVCVKAKSERLEV